MSSREAILQAVNENKPDFIGLPLMDQSVTIRYADKVKQFIETMENSGGQVFYQDSEQLLLQDIEDVKAEGKFVINLLGDEADEIWKNMSSSELEGLDTCYLRGQLGVAENAAIWITEKQMSNRLLPFICQHLVIVLDPNDMVNNMHEAYDQIDASSEGFGVFIAGPSKTADIEQNLVIGAHGARSLRVYLMEDEI